MEPKNIRAVDLPYQDPFRCAAVRAQGTAAHRFTLITLFSLLNKPWKLRLSPNHAKLPKCPCGWFASLYIPTKALPCSSPFPHPIFSNCSQSLISDLPWLMQLQPGSAGRSYQFPTMDPPPPTASTSPPSARPPTLSASRHRLRLPPPSRAVAHACVHPRIIRDPSAAAATRSARRRPRPATSTARSPPPRLLRRLPPSSRPAPARVAVCWSAGRSHRPRSRCTRDAPPVGFTPAPSPAVSPASPFPATAASEPTNSVDMP
jgi:hypothetical protein